MRAGRNAVAASLLSALVLAVAASGAERVPRIVGGGKANAAGWRFAVAVEQKRRLICTGSVIGAGTVLTAAHCVKGGKRRQLSVLAGSAWISGPRRGPRIKVRSVAIDPAFNGRKDARDFAVLTLARDAGVEPIALPTPGEAKAATRPGRTVRSAGWGARSPWGFDVARRLKSAKERVFHADRCDRAYGKARGFQGTAMICALGGRIHRPGPPFHSTSCEGDSGGPVVANTPAGPRLVGVVSAGVFPCGLRFPSIYARVADRLGFIERTISG